MTELHYLSIAQAADLIRTRALSPVELTRALLERADCFDGQLNSYITRTADLAMRQAQDAERAIMKGGYRGPLHGMPYGLKDLIDTQGILTTGNSRTQQHNVPESDATVVSRLRDAGAVLLGKQTAHEFAHGGPSFDLPWPPARNPWNPECFTGGSSSGSAAGVAAGFMPVALGTDTGGSIRTPASFCGLVGLKPTYGLVSRWGIMPHSFSLDHCGPLTRTVEDCALVLQAIAGHDPRDPGSVKTTIPDYRAALRQSVKGLRIGVLRHMWEEDNPAGEELRQATEAAISVLKDLGAQVETARVQPVQIYSDVKAVICECEAFAVQRPHLARHLHDYGADYLTQILLALLFQGGDYVRAQRHRRVLVREMQPLYEKFDVLVTAGAGPAPRLSDQGAKDALVRWGQPSATTLFNVTGAPAMMLCSGYARNGLPLGIQFAGRPFEEATVLSLGHAYQRETDWHERHPLLDAARGAAVPPPEAAPRDLPRPDDASCAAIQLLAESAGIHLNEALVWRLAAGIPVVRKILARIPDHGWTDEPSSVFRCLDD